MLRPLLALVLCASTCADAADTFTFSAPPGPHAVGFKVVQQYDRSRLYKLPLDLVTGEPVSGERSRPIQTLVWYPAARGGPAMTYRRYIDTFQTEDDFSRSAAEVQKITAGRIENNSEGHRDALLRDVARPMLAVRDARAEPGKFPVVIYAPSFSASAAENADLCEYLASLGYVVLASPSMGTHTRAMTLDLEGLEAQAADISYLIGYAATLPQADANKVGVVGYSWGGLANVVAAAKDARIAALVSLDGSLRGYPEYVDGGKDAIKYVTPARVQLPLLYLSARPKSLEDFNREETSTKFSFMNQMKYSDVYIVSFLPMIHPHFAAFGMRMMPDAAFGDYTRDEVSRAHSWMARYTGQFLQAYLKGDAKGLAFLNNTPRANQAPEHMLIADTRRKQDGLLAPTMDNFVARLAAEGFDKAPAVYDRFAAQGFKLTENEILGWGTQLYRLMRFDKAREIFRLGTHVYPKMTFMYDALASSQAKAGQTQEAVATYRRLLELDPKHADAQKFLKEHGAAQ